MTQTDVLSPRTFCPHGHFVPTDILSAGRFVLTDVLSNWRFVCPDVLSPRTFCLYGRFVPGRFVSGCFVWAPSNSLPMAGTFELLNCSVGMDQKKNIELHSIKTVFHGSKQLKMKMERPSIPTRPSGVIARGFLPYPHLQYTQPFTQCGRQTLPFKSPPQVPLLTTQVCLFKVLAIHIPPPPSYYTNHLGLKATSMLISLRNIATKLTLNISYFVFKV